MSQLLFIKGNRKGHGPIPTFLPQWWYSKIKRHVQSLPFWWSFNTTVITNRGQMIGVGQQLRNTYDELAGTHPSSSIHIGPDRKQELLNLATQLQPLQLLFIKDNRKGHGPIPTFLPQWWYSKIKRHVQSLPFWWSFNIYYHYKLQSNDWVGQQLRNTNELARTHPPSAIHIGPDRKQEVLNLGTELQPLQLFSIKDYRKGHGAIPTFLPQ